VIELEGGQVAEGLLLMFDPDVPTYSRVVAVLADRNPGNILVDDREDPTWCVVREVGWHHTFVGGRPDASALADAVARLREDGEVWLITWDGQPPELPDAPAPDIQLPLLELSERPADDAALDLILAGLPAGFDIRRMDRALVERCEWRGYAAGASGGAESFIRDGLGFCLMNGREILCEVYAIYWGIDTAEIGVITNEEHRGQGYATLTCAHLVRACEKRGYRTTWTCRPNNPASAAVARRLGHRRERTFTMLRYSRAGT
jgi:RimJ/RimL family protein N-acetyltransferase